MGADEYKKKAQSDEAQIVLIKKTMGFVQHVQYITVGSVMAHWDAYFHMQLLLRMKI